MNKLFLPLPAFIPGYLAKISLHRIAALFLLAYSSLLFAADGDDYGLQNDWSQVKDKNGIQVYMKHSDNSRMKTFRGETIMTTRNTFAPAAVMLDFENSDKWLYLSKMSELDRRSIVDRTLQIETFLPWPLRDRATLAHAVMTQDAETLRWDAILQETKHPASELLKKDFVLLPEFNITAFVEPLNGDQVKVGITAILDPGGYIPAWAANLILADLPYYSLERIRRSIEKPEYRNSHLDFLVYPENKATHAVPTGESVSQ